MDDNTEDEEDSIIIPTTTTTVSTTDERVSTPVSPGLPDSLSASSVDIVVAACRNGILQKNALAFDDANNSCLVDRVFFCSRRRKAVAEMTRDNGNSDITIIMPAVLVRLVESNYMKNVSSMPDYLMIFLVRCLITK